MSAPRSKTRSVAAKITRCCFRQLMRTMHRAPCASGAWARVRVCGATASACRRRASIILVRESIFLVVLLHVLATCAHVDCEACFAVERHRGDGPRGYGPAREPGIAP